MALADARAADGTRPLAQASALDGLLLGLAQTCALVPGVSRSGAVLTAARARGFGRADSDTLARRTGLPVIVGAGALKTGRLLQRGAASGAPIPGGRALLLGGGASFLSTLAATRLLRRSRRAARAALCPTRSTVAARALVALVAAMPSERPPLECVTHLQPLRALPTACSPKSSRRASTRAGRLRPAHNRSA